MDLPAVPVKELRALAAILRHICPLHLLLVTSATVQHCGKSLATLFPEEMGNCFSNEATVLTTQTPIGYLNSLSAFASWELPAKVI